MMQEPLNSTNAQSARSRYPGTRPFSDTPDDYALFFGRGEESEQLYLRVLSVPLLVQFGKSGLGKTSLLQASLFPRLRQKPFLPVMVRLNVTDDTLPLAVARSIEQACKTEGLELTNGRTDRLWELLSTTTVWRDDLLLTPVLVFDQFEEVFTLRDAAFRTDLAAELGGLFSGIVPEHSRVGGPEDSEQAVVRPNIKVVISLREDYLGNLEEFSNAIPNLFHERLRLEPLTEKAAREAITEPAKLTSGSSKEPYWAPRFEFEPSALGSMIAYLKGNSGVIEPFQLQLLCRHAEAIARGKGNPQDGLVMLAPADFSGKGFGSVLKDFYQNTLLQLDGSQRRKAQELCEEGLLDASGHRLMLEEGQIRGEFGITTPTLTALSQQRLLRRERRLESAFYEISHDRLAESILRSKGFRLPKKARRALWTAGVVAPLVVAVLVFWAVSLKQERKKSDTLVGFLLGDFLEEVRDIGRSTMLRQVQEKVKDVSNVSALNLGLALRNRGDLERTHGSVAESTIHYAQALKAFESSPDVPHSRRELARTHDRLGDALTDQGQVTEALSHYEDAVKAWRQVLANASSGAAKDCTSLADSLVSVAEIKDRMGEGTHALTDLEEALKITSSVLFRYQTSQNECGDVAEAEPYPDAKALEVAAYAALSRAQMLNFKEDYEGAAALAMEARRLNPPSVSVREHALVALAWRGNGRLGTPQLALDDYRAALREFEELRRWDPTNRLWQRQRAANQLRVGEGIVACNASKTKDCNPLPSLEEAQALDLEAIATLRALASSDAANTSWQEDLGWALQEEARVLAAARRQPERLATLEKAEQIYRTCQRNKADTEAIQRLGGLLSQKSNALAALGRLAEARESSQASIDLFEEINAAHPDNPVYISELRGARQSQAEILRRSGDKAGADAADREGKQLDDRYGTLIGIRNGKTNELYNARRTHVIEGAKLYKEGAYTAALREFNVAESAGREYVVLLPANYTGYRDLRGVYRWIQSTQEKLGNAKERIASLNAALYAAKIEALLAPDDSRIEANTTLLEAWHEFGIFLYHNNRLGDALAMVQEEIAVAERLVQDDKQKQAEKHAAYLWRLGNATCGLGMLRRQHEKTPGWEETIRSGLIQEEKAAEVDTKRPSYLNELGDWRKYLGDQLNADGRKEEASAEYQLALKAYQAVARRFRGNEKAEKAIRDLAEHGVR